MKLHQFPISRKAGINNFSPFCLKMETYLRVNNLPYEVVPFTGNPGKGAPKGKLPFVEFEDGRRIPDSAIIIKTLKDENGVDLNARLTPEEKAISHAFEKMIEDHLGQVMLYFRWQDQKGWSTTKGAFFKGLPAFLQLFVPELVRKGTVKSLWGMGMGRHLKEEVRQFGLEDLKALSEFLNEKEYFFGNEISNLDVTAYGFLANFHHDLNPELKTMVESFPNLVNLKERIHQKYYSN